ncbi:MAG: DNA mismatch repair endonuclease MutL [Phycisphaerales bacterium]
MPAPIRVLPALLVNQIAAGEVVERPASVVKELVENALDAGAKRIDVAIEGGGRELIQVTDDGCGIPAEELPLSVAPHATSKISRPEDLEAIATMGFRGEALASIASVARVTILSRTADADAAAEMQVEGDRVQPPRPASGPLGTTVTVRTLFFNTPARRKFLKSESSEAGRIADTIEAIALGHPSVRFTLRSESRVMLDLAATDDPKRRALDVLGKEHEPKLLEAEGEDGAVTVWGLVGRPELARPSTKHLRIHLNGRPVADRAIIHALREAYRGLIEPGATPMAAVFLELDPREVDVNVHPAKTEVRFRQPSLIHQAVLRAVRRALRAADLVPAFELESAPTPWRINGGGDGGAAPSFGGGGFAFARADVQSPTPIVYEDVARGLGPKPWETATSASPLPTIARAVEILQVHSSYVVTQDEQGILIVDQHALHERVMFEKLFERITHGPLERQRLLVPAIIEASPREIEALDDLRPLLDRVGVDAEPAGPRSVAIYAFPSLLFERRVDPAEFVRELLGRAADGSLAGGAADTEAALHETLDMMACKAAIKAGDRLTPEELRDLLAWRERVERSTNCPHGRPTSLRITLRDLERQFGRG